MAADPELITYIRQQTQDGVTAHELRETLMEAGWNELDVDNALHDVAAGLKPVTEGASIHEDLAQVRGMVAHLASRVQKLETRLSAAPASSTLPAGTDVPARELPRPHSRGRWALAMLMVSLVAVGEVGVARAFLGGAFEAQTTIGLAVLLLVFLVVVLMKLRRRSR